MKSMFRGKYEKKIYTTFLVAFSLLIVTFMILLTTNLTQRAREQQKSTILHGMELDWNASQLKMGLLFKELERVMESISAFEFATAETRSFTYFHAIKLQKELQIATNRMNGMNFSIAVMALENPNFIITPTSSESLEYFFSHTLPMNTEQVDRVFTKLHQGTQVTTVMTEGLKPQIVHFVRKSIDNVDLLFVLGVELQDFLLPSSHYRWWLANRHEIFAWSIFNTKFQGSAQYEAPELYHAFMQFSTNPQEERFFSFKDHYIYTYPIEATGWSLLIEYPYIDTIWYTTALDMVLPYGVAVLVALLVSWLVTRLIYQPVGKLMKEVSADSLKPADLPMSHDSVNASAFPQDPRTSEGSRKGQYDEFSLLKKRTSRVQELNERLQATLVERNQLLRQRLHRDLLFGVKSSIAEAEKAAGGTKSYCVALLEFRNDIFDETRNFRTYKDVIAEYVHDTDSLGYANLAVPLCAIIVACKDITSGQVCIQELASSLPLEEGDTVQIAISSVRQGEEALHRSYKECLKILEYRFLFRNRMILTMEQVQSMEQTQCYYPLSLENRLIHYAVQGDMRVMRLYKNLLDENGGELALAPETRKQLVLSLSGTIHRIFQELKVLPDEVFSAHNEIATPHATDHGSGSPTLESASLLTAQNIESLASRWNHMHIFTEISDILSHIFGYVREEKEQQESELATTLLEFIHTNYHKDIMLIDLAEELNVSEKYCGILFKQRTGENFKTYLNQYRISKAQEFIKEQPSLKVTELATRVGFNSSNTFIRVFAKLVGATPGQYADEIIEK